MNACIMGVRGQKYATGPDLKLSYLVAAHPPNSGTFFFFIFYSSERKIFLSLHKSGPDLKICNVPSPMHARPPVRQMLDFP